MNEKFFALPEEKQTVMLNAALKTFALMGYRKASTGDIAAEAGVSKSLLFHYFGTKLELFDYLFHYAIDVLADTMSGFEYRENEDLFAMMGSANDIKIGIFKRHPYLYKFVYQSYFEENPDVQTIVRGRNDQLIQDNMPDVLRHMDRTKLKAGLPPEKALQLILWVSEGFLQSRLMSDNIEPESLLTDFNEWMRLLKLCFYKEELP